MCVWDMKSIENLNVSKVGLFALFFLAQNFRDQKWNDLLDEKENVFGRSRDDLRLRASNPTWKRKLIRGLIECLKRKHK